MAEEENNEPKGPVAEPVENMDPKELIDEFDESNPRGENEDPDPSPEGDEGKEGNGEGEGTGEAEPPAPEAPGPEAPAPAPEPAPQDDQWDARKAAADRFANVQDEGTRALLIEAALVGKDLAREEAAQEAQKATAAADQLKQEEADVLAQMEQQAVTDIKAATDAGRVPAVADATDPQDPGNVRQKQVWSYITIENQRRAANPLKPLITDFETGLDLLEASEMREAAKKVKEQEAELKKSRGAKVSGGTPRTGNQPKTSPILSGQSLDAVLAADFEELRSN